MNLFPTVLTEAAEPAAGGGWTLLIGYIVFFAVLIYFMVIRPQKKQQRKQDELMRSIELGDSVLTSAGFYGVVIDIVDEEVVIVEFGNNKNCRIPMRKTAVVEVEKQNKE